MILLHNLKSFQFTFAAVEMCHNLTIQTLLGCERQQLNK